MKSDLLALSLLALVTFGLYGGTLGYPFVYDDTHVIVNNDRIQDPSYIPKLYYTPGMYSFGDIEKVSYRPFLTTTYSLDYMFSGLDPVSYRLTNLLIHILCGFFVYLLACRLIGAARPGSGPGQPGGTNPFRAYALGAALLFIAHPVQSEAVLYISARSASLTALACLASLWFFIKYRTHRKTAWFAASVGAYVLGLLSKETALPFALIFPLVGRALDRRAAAGDTVPVRTYVPYFAAAALYLSFRVYFFALYGLQGLESGGYAENLAGSLAALPGYLRLILLPFGLSIDHYPGPAPGFTGPALLMGVLLVAAPLVASIYLYRSRPVASALLAWPIILMSLEVMVPVEDLLVEYRLYMPMASISILLACAAVRVPGAQYGLKARAWLAVFAAAFAAMLALSHDRARIWQSPASLWSDAVHKYPGNPRAHNNLGESMATGDPVGALKQFEEAVRLNPDYDDALNNLGAALVDTGRTEEAVGRFRAALAVDKRHYNANFNLVLALTRLGRYEEAHSACAAMAAEYPGSAEVAYLSEMVDADAGKLKDGETPPDETAKPY